jgi:hypothetical protein
MNLNKKWLLPALVLALIGTSAPASATNILFASGEDSGFTSSNSLYTSIDTTSGLYRSSFAREALKTFYDNGSYYLSPAFTATSNLWFHAYVYYGSNYGEFANDIGLILYSPDGNARILLRQTGTQGQFKISTKTASGTVTDLATTSSNINPLTLHVMDLHVSYTCSSAGGVTLYEDGVQVINYSGNPCTDSATSLNQVALGVLGATNGSNTSCGNGGDATCWSEIIVADGDTRGMALWTLAPQASGNTQSWTPNTVGDINPTSINDSNFIATTTTGALSEWTTPTSPPSGAWNVLAVAQDARVSAGYTGPQHFEWLARTKDGSDHVTGSVAPLDGSFSNYNGVWATNPYTSSAWSITDIAAGFNLGIESLN